MVHGIYGMLKNLCSCSYGGCGLFLVEITCGLSGTSVAPSSNWFTSFVEAVAEMSRMPSPCETNCDSSHPSPY